ncbi:MAG: hypothetical protein UR26_C0001G0095 [candidate division TM6 bacterium GW2011_GWF2_32_72]|nr:MAG: hypothetical protein UR26_C0001G0095 [candidate division TM6 bacterium GW2011_GWF2_32_72]
MLKRQSKPGYTLMLTMISIMALIAVFVFISSRATNYFRTSGALMDKEQAKLLALGGLQIAFAQLNQDVEKKAEKEEKGMPTDVEGKKLKELLPILNRWQEFPLTYKADGVDGEIKICICCENGKIDINSIYDFKKHKFVDEPDKKSDKQGENQKTQEKEKFTIRKSLETLFKNLSTKVGGKDLFASFEKFLKERKYRLNDVTELFEMPEFMVFKDKIFYNPDSKDVALNDVFTTWSVDQKIQPWVLSHSLVNLFGLSEIQVSKDGILQKNVEKALGSFKRNANWQQDWDKSLKEVYGKDYKTLSKDFGGWLNSQFEVNLFSVISWGKFRNMTQKLCAIIEKSDDKQSDTGFRILKLYWL